MANEFEDLIPSSNTRPQSRSTNFNEFEDLIPKKQERQFSFGERMLEAAKPEIDYPEIGYGAYLGGKRALGAVGQFAPTKAISEPATQMAKSAQKAIEEKGSRQAGAFLFDVLGLGKLVRPLEAATRTGRMLKSAGVAGGATALTTPALEQDKGFGEQKLEQFAIGGLAGSVGQGIKEGLNKLIPGALTTANEPTEKLLREAESRGITIPISDLTESAFLRALDRVFENPLMARNAPIVSRELNRAMGQSGDVIDLGTAATKLSNEIESVLKDKTVRLAGLSSGAQEALQRTYSSIPALEARPLQKIISSAQQMGSVNVPISGKEWHLARRKLNDEFVSKLRSGDTQEADALRKLIDEWDDAAYRSLGTQFKKDFIDWKAKWTAFADVSEAANRNEGSRQLILRGMVDPADLMNVVAKKRSTEFLERPFAQGTRPQTSLGAVGGGLDVFGKEATAVAPYVRAGTALGGLLAMPFTGGFTGTLPVGLAMGKGLQSYLYSPRGQQLMMRGVSPQPTTRSFAVPTATVRQFLPASEEQ